VSGPLQDRAPVFEAHQSCGDPVVLKTVYAVAAPRDACRTPQVRIEALSPREAFLALVAGTFNRRLVSTKRMERQFDAMAGLSDRVIVKTLAYPRAIDRRPDVRDAVLADLRRV
jgi:hypothetical protein